MAETRGARPQVVLEVLTTERIGEHLVRVVAGGPGFADYENNSSTDRYAKLFFTPAGSPLEPPYDLAVIRETLPQDQWPVVRTYTLRSVGEDHLVIDFVVHGTEGVAGPWAAAAQPGDRFALAGPGGAYAPDPAADWHLLAGDLSAFPAIAAALEAMPSDARGHAYIEARELSVAAPAGVIVHWVDDLAEAVRAGEWLPGSPQVFAHGERESMKALREIFRTRGVPRERLSLSGYWARGRTEDRFQAEKREPIGQIPD